MDGRRPGNAGCSPHPRGVLSKANSSYPPLNVVEEGPLAGFQSGNFFRRNIVCDIKENMFHPQTNWTERSVAQTDYNLFFNVADGKSYLESRRQEGHEVHSLIADPLFVDPKNDDYRLKPESPVFKLGFQPIAIDRIGLKEKQ